jgi:glycosidase
VVHRRREKPDGEHGDYYIWRKSENGAPPNNWNSFFSGPAWGKAEGRDEWYLHLFSRKQPDLNWENPKVRDSACEIIDFWREKGVDGFRLDVINYKHKPRWRTGTKRRQLLGSPDSSLTFTATACTNICANCAPRAF